MLISDWIRHYENIVGYILLKILSLRDLYTKRKKRSIVRCNKDIK